MLLIKNNLMAVNAARHLGNSYNALAKSVERLASGLRINSAQDDAAGLAVRELMRADIAVIEQAVRNAQDGISLLQTMEGAMATIDDALGYVCSSWPNRHRQVLTLRRRELLWRVNFRKCVRKSIVSQDQLSTTILKCSITLPRYQSTSANFRQIISVSPAAT